MATATSDSWYWLDGKRPIGPFSAEQLRAAVSAGTVQPGTMVRNSAWDHWCQAAQVPGLCPIRVAAPAEGVESPPEGFALPPLAEPKHIQLAVPSEGLPKTSHGDGKTARLAAPPSGWSPAQPEQARPVRLAAPPDVGASSPPPISPPAENFSVQEVWSDRPARATKVKKKGPPIALFFGFLGVLPACVALVFVVLKTYIPSDTENSEKRPVAQAPKRPKEAPAEKPKQAAAELPTADFSLNPMSGAGYDRATFELLTPATPQGRIDELVFAKLKEVGIEPANPCSDPVFLRRVYLDVIGTLPTVEEAKAFLADKSPDKRKKLIDALLERPEFAEYLAMKWCDILRVKAEFPINLWPNAAQAYHRWIRNSIRDGLPYDKFVREMLTSSGSNFRVPQVNFYRALQSKDPKSIARTVALTFMGSRADKWPDERLTGMSAFFLKLGYKRTGEWKEEIVFFDPDKVYTPPPPPGPAPKPDAKKTAAKKAAKAAPVPPPKPVFPDGTTAEIPLGKDPRIVFADWLVTPKNPWFTRHIANRVWYWVMGRGIVHEPDDIRPDNPASNPELLNWLGDELVKADYDLKHLYRLILNSSTYQLSSIPKSKDPKAAIYFASYTVRRLEAEVIIDALNQITGTTESYMSIIPEPYTFVPETRRAISLPDGSITSAFLELFGRPSRDSGMESERNNRITAGQRLHLLNSNHVRKKLNGPGIQRLREGNARENLYLAILSRFPGDLDWGDGGDLPWELINSTEFLFRH